MCKSGYFSSYVDGLGRHTHAHFWQVHMRGFMRNWIGKCQINGDFKKTSCKIILVRRNI